MSDPNLFSLRDHYSLPPNSNEGEDVQGPLGLGRDSTSNYFLSECGISFSTFKISFSSHHTPLRDAIIHRWINRPRGVKKLLSQCHFASKRKSWDSDIRYVAYLVKLVVLSSHWTKFRFLPWAVFPSIGRRLWQLEDFLFLSLQEILLGGPGLLSCHFKFMLEITSSGYL